MCGFLWKAMAVLLVLFIWILGLEISPACGGDSNPAGVAAGFLTTANVRVGGVLDVDYRHFLEDQRADNRFDIRRARLILAGEPAEWFRFLAQYEFQASASHNLIDAYVEAGLRHALRIGQFKEPFGLEWQTPDTAIVFAERAMTQHLAPDRGVGAMLRGGWGQGYVYYGVGIFNADGDDGASRGAHEDTPEFCARLVAAPFKSSALPWIENLQAGVSYSHADIEIANLSLKVKSAGMIGTTHNIYVLSHNTKFGVLQDIQSRGRFGAEAAWAWGPVLVQGEYMTLKYTGLQAAGRPSADARFSAWHAGAAIVLTGENWIFQSSVPRPVYPLQPLDPRTGRWGAFILAARVEQFNGDEDWITPGAFVSVRQAKAYSIGLTWAALPIARVIFDFTHTDLSDPIRVRVNPDGTVKYISRENVFTLRFGIDF